MTIVLLTRFVCGPVLSFDSEVLILYTSLREHHTYDLSTSTGVEVYQLIGRHDLRVTYDRL